VALEGYKKRFQESLDIPCKFVNNEGQYVLVNSAGKVSNWERPESLRAQMVRVSLTARVPKGPTQVLTYYSL
jgi:hypothetical protein